MSNVASTLLPFLATMSNEISSFDKSRNKLNMFNLFRLCRKDEILQQNRSTLLPFVATKSNAASTMLPVASTLLHVWTGPWAYAVSIVLTLTVDWGIFAGLGHNRAILLYSEHLYVASPYCKTLFP